MRSPDVQRSAQRRGHRRVLPWLCLAAIVIMWSVTYLGPPASARAQDTHDGIAGRVLDEQGIPVTEALVALYLDQDAQPVDETETQPDGTFLVFLPDDEPVAELHLDVERPHFQTETVELGGDELDQLLSDGTVVLDDIVLGRHFGVSFWVTTITFVLMLAIIATERLHKTLAALLAVAILFSISLVGGAFNESFFIFDFEHALEFVDFDVIFLLMGMMIVIGVIEETGIFQWLAYQAYRLSRGRVWLLSIILMSITAVTSALLDNVTTMLLMAPITLQIALAVGLNPLALLLPEVLASNVGGLATLVGEPTNILVGSYAGFSFNDFLINLTPGVMLSMLGLFAYVQLRYRQQYAKHGAGLSPALLERLRQNAQIEDTDMLKKAGIVFGILMLLFIFGEAIHLPPAVAAIIGAVAMLIWVHPHVEEMMGVVDWTTLMFFIALFIVIGAIQEIGLISLITSAIGALVADNLTAAMLAVVWLAAMLSGVVDNIPFTAAMLPVVNHLTGVIPGAGNMMLFYALAVGAAMGGNTTLIGASANMVTAGIAERAGYPITFKGFLAVGLPSVFITTALGTIWLFIHFF